MLPFPFSASVCLCWFRPLIRLVFRLVSTGAVVSPLSLCMPVLVSPPQINSCIFPFMCALFRLQIVARRAPCRTPGKYLFSGYVHNREQCCPNAGFSALPFCTIHLSIWRRPATRWAQSRRLWSACWGHQLFWRPTCCRAPRAASPHSCLWIL